MANTSISARLYAYISNSASASVTVLDAMTKTVVIPSITVGDNPGPMALTQDGAYLYVGNENYTTSHSVSVIETGPRRVVATIDVSQNAKLCPTSMALSPDGGTVYVALHDPDPEDDFFQVRSAVCAIATSGPKQNTITAAIDLSFGGPPVDNWPSADGGCGALGELAVRTNPDQLYAPVGGANKIAVIDTKTNWVVKTIPAGSGPWLAFAPNGLHYYEVNTYNLGVTVFNAADDSMAAEDISPNSCETPESLVVTPDSRWLYIACVDSSSLCVIDSKNLAGQPLTIPLPFKPSSPPAITPDGSEVWAVGGGDDAVLVVIPTSTNIPSAPIPLPQGGPARIVFGRRR